jgi:hypothetical protein
VLRRLFSYRWFLPSGLRWCPSGAGRCLWSGACERAGQQNPNSAAEYQRAPYLKGMAAHRDVPTEADETLDKAPAQLAEGEIALGLGNDPPRMWIGTPDGVKEFGAEIREMLAALEAAWRLARGDDSEKP